MGFLLEDAGAVDLSLRPDAVDRQTDNGPKNRGEKAGESEGKPIQNNSLINLLGVRTAD